MRLGATLLILLLLGCKKGAESKKDNGRKIYKTIIIGSSIAAGVGASSYSTSWAGLISANNILDTFLNLSKPGYLTFHFLPSNFSSNSIRPDTSVNISNVIRLKPDVVLISITTNDITYGYSPRTYMSNLRVITDTLEARSIKFIVTSTTLRNDFSKAQSDSAFSICKYLKDEYSGEGKYVEIMSAIADTVNLKINTGFYSTDLIHPNDKGHLLIFKKIQSQYLKLK